MTPAVAIVIPCYNDGDYIEETLASIDVELDVEVIIVDDGSTDAATIDTLAAINAAGQARVVTVPNGGPGRARMAGVAATTAPYVLPLDSDDRLLPGGIEAMAALLDERPEIAFAFGDYEAFGTAEGRWKTPEWNPWALLYANWWPVTSLFRRSALIAVGGWQLHGYEDWDLLMALAEHGERGAHCGAAVYARRLHGERVNTAARRQHKHRYSVLRKRHPDLFARRRELSRAVRPSLTQRIAYPWLLGDRRFFPIAVENAAIAHRLRRGARAT